MNVRKLRQTLGVAGFVLIVLVSIEVAAFVYYDISGMGRVPEVRFELVARGDSIVLKVVEGMVSKRDWEYQVFDRRVNPPGTWKPGVADLTPGSEIQLASGLTPGAYRVRVRHVPTAAFLLDSFISL